MTQTGTEQERGEGKEGGERFGREFLLLSEQSRERMERWRKKKRVTLDTVLQAGWCCAV